MYVSPPSITTVRPWFAMIGYNGEIRAKGTLKKSCLPPSPSHPSPPTPVVGEMHKEAQQTVGGPTSLGATSKERAHPQLSSGHDASVDSTVEADPRKFAPSDFVPQQQDEPIIISDESEEDEEVAKDKDNEDTSIPPPPSLKLAQIQELMAQPSYPDINQLTELLVTSLKPKLSKLFASHNFARFLLTKLKEPPSKITELSREIKELKQHVRDMEIELHGDLVEIPTKLNTFTSNISSLSSQVAELKNIQWKLPAEFLNLPSQVSSVQEKL
ncbi:hypothetical protein Tco_0134266 [Tanacetum coccineum]